MEHEKQVAAVEKALNYTRRIQQDKRRLARLKEEIPPEKPQMPIKQNAIMETPKIETKTKFRWYIGFALGIFTRGIGFFLYFFLYRYLKKREAKRIANSDEYLQACSAAELSFQKEQAGLDKAFEEAEKEYWEVSYPAYQRELSQWKKKRETESEEIREELRTMEDELRDHYDRIQIIPRQYRDVYALRYIYEMISTSAFDVVQAIESYERMKLHQVNAERLDEQQAANQLAFEQNELLYEQNEISRKKNRDDNIAAAVEIMQRHKMNKTLEKRK